MTSSNLAVVFQPGLVSTRSNNLNSANGTGLLGFPGFDESGRIGEAGKGKEVLEFLIDYQNYFVFGSDGEGEGSNDLNYASGIHGKENELERSGLKEKEDGLARRASDKSVERRRLRKSIGSAGEGRVKRSKTLPSGKKIEREFCLYFACLLLELTRLIVSQIE